MKTLFIASGPISWGSSRMRCFWPARYMDADVLTIDQLQHTRNLDQYGALIFQKTFSIEIARQARTTNRLVFWDVCDPVWWFAPDKCREILPHVDGVVASSEALAADFTEWAVEKVEITPFSTGRPEYVKGAGIEAVHIPDRLEPSHFPLRREHQDVDPLRFIWFGVSVNRIALGAAWANLERLWANGYNFELTIFDNEPGQPLFFAAPFPVNYVRWELHKENRVLTNHDVALLPPYPGPWGMVKSDNKRMTSSICGLPVVSGASYNHLKNCFSAQFRNTSSEAEREIFCEDWHVKHSAAEWEAIIENAHRSR